MSLLDQRRLPRRGRAQQLKQPRRLERDLHDAAELPELAPAVARLGAYRGVAELGALSLTAEVGDWRRFPSAGSFMAFTGLVPSEYSSGGSQRRGHITKTGNAHVRTQLVESAWAYQHRPLISTRLKARQHDVSADTLARSWKAQLRLCRKWLFVMKRGWACSTRRSAWA